MKTYKWANNITGWVVFAIAAITYLLTIEPTASFWDCGEFIAAAYKLQVGHPPGAPIFMLVGNIVSHLASDTSTIATMLNGLSAIFSAFTILFLFWTITHLAKKLVAPDNQSEVNLSQLIMILGAGAVGALAYAFSDTFWFSAVEGEVYAFSSFMTAIVVWLILKWEDVADEPHSDRWLILIAYLIGVSIAIHLLNLLCVPVIVLVYYFRKNANPTFKGAVIALLISFGILAAILYGLVQGLVEVCGWFELLLVNVLHLPYNSGVIFYLILIFGVLSWAIWETMRESNEKRSKIAFLLSIALLGIPFIGSGIWVGILLIAIFAGVLFWSKKINTVVLNTILVGLLVITMGYSSYALIMIRSTSNPPMDQNSPNDIFTLATYLNREQYGETPLFYGRTFVSEVKYEAKGGMMEAVSNDEGPIWTRIPKKDISEKDRYYESGRKTRYVYVDELNMLFPRMHSSDPRHIQSYKEWSNFKGARTRVNSPQGNKTVMMPTFGENLRFFFQYQVNFMYWRYFMWNFAGRQNDIQGSGEVSNGNWITGIKFLDEMRVGPQDNMPDSIAKNKGHNKYYMLPLLLGILGILFQIYSGRKGTEQFWITFLLFFMTGLAIVVYLNQAPFQPRERDYAYAGSFYAFCIWIGLGTAAIVSGLRNYLKVPATVASIAGVALCLLIPIQMVSQTWDDHDRSGRYIARDFGKNYLATCEPNAIIFTNGDNDTFPLWYAQDVEGFRTDVRVCNLSYLQTDWYIDQMKRQAYESEPLPIDWKKHEYVMGQNDVVHFFDVQKEPMSVVEMLNRIKSDDPRDKRLPGYSFEMSNIPTYKIMLPVDSAGVIASGVVKPENADWILPYLPIDFGERRNEKDEVTASAKRYLAKNELMILEMLKNTADWSRPIYFALTVGPEQYMRMENYFRQDGVAYRVMPFNTSRNQNVDTDILYDNVMNKYEWGNLEQPDLYVDENSIRMVRTFRLIFGRLAQELVAEGDSARAEEVADRCLQVLPEYNIPYDFYSINDFADVYHRIGNIEKANDLYNKLAGISMRNLNWFSRLNNKQYVTILEDVRRDLYYMQHILYYFSENDKDAFERYAKEYEQHMQRFQQFMGGTRRGGFNR